MSTEVEILQLYKKSLIQFLEELVDAFPEEADLMIALLFVRTQLIIKDSIEVFMHQINNNNGLLRKMISERNDTFFLEHGVFEDFGKEKVNHFKTVWTSPSLTDEERNAIWDWVDTFVRIGDKYMKLK